MKIVRARNGEMSTMADCSLVIQNSKEDSKIESPYKNTHEMRESAVSNKNKNNFFNSKNEYSDRKSTRPESSKGHQNIALEC
jgi:hypothetical protein